MVVAPYGSWPSPLSVDLVASGGLSLPGGFVDGDDLYWLVGDPAQRGRVSLFRRRAGTTGDSVGRDLATDGGRAGGSPVDAARPTTTDSLGSDRAAAWATAAAVELTPDHNLRSRVHEYGGLPAAAWGGVVVYTDYASGHVFVLEDAAPARPLVAVEGLRHGGFSVLPTRRQVVCLQEDHRQPGGVVDRLVVLDLDGDNHDGGRVLAEGADFYYAPQVSATGDVVWLEWDHPHMPWDVTRLRARHLDGGPVRQIAGDGRVAQVYPSWGPDGSILYLSDESGFWNFHRFEAGVDRPLHRHPHDFAGPPWILQPPPYALLPDGSIGCSWLADGWPHLGLLRPDGRLDELALIPDQGGPDGAAPRLVEDDRAATGQPPPDGAPVLATVELTPAQTDPGESAGGRPLTPVSVVGLGFPDRPGGLFTLDWARRSLHEVARSSAVELAPGLVARPRDFTWPSPDGPVHAWFYPPTHPDRVGPTDERPPVLVWSHGGPTSFARPGFDLAKLFWTSRGVGLLDVNYGGSSGFGRAYRERLAGRWGVVDVRDCAEGPRRLAEAGLADPARLAIEGGSAGGFTTLACLCFTDAFAAGVTRYGVGDLEALATDTHKFEAHYLDGLVGPYPAERQRYLDRSPIHHLDGLNCPLLILQGEDDAVVPKQQALDLAAAVERKGLKATLVIYPGEGHGFRQAATIRDQYARTLAFLAEVFGFRPDGA